MASSMDTHVKLPYKSVIRKLVFRNIVVFVSTTFALSASLNSGLFSDPIASPLSSCKAFCVAIGLLELFFWSFLVQNSQRMVVNFLKCCGLLFTSTVIFHCLAILYGAPFLNSSAETYHFAMLLAVTTVLPSCRVLGPQFHSWIRIYILNSPEVGVESVLHITTIFALIGAWLGAVPIPLDWDRPWQVWPISCVLGNLCGYLIGLLISVAHLLYQTRGRKSKLF